MSYEKIQELDFSGALEELDVSRRDFLRGLGGGIFVFFSIGHSVLDAQWRGKLPDDFNAFLQIGTDGRVTCFTGKIEMGQGIITSLAQMLADELQVSLDSVDMVMGDTDRCPWDRGTFGSLSTRVFGPQLRAAAAEARMVLIELAGERLEVPKDRLKAEDGAVFDTRNRRNRVTYADLAGGEPVARRLEGKPELEDPSEFTVSGRPTHRTDAVEKVIGQAQYAGDIRVPGMLCAAILRPPAHGATLTALDTGAAEAMDGARIVRDGDLVAALHENPDGARRARAALEPDWDVPEPEVNDETIFEHLLQSEAPERVVDRGGNLDSGRKLAARSIDSTYLDGYVAHAPMEPHTALAQIEGDKVTVWASTQTPFPAKEEVANALGIPSENVRVITPFVGGGFGGKTRNLQVVEAARLAKKVGRPVQVAWSRSDEFFHDSYRPAAVVKIQSGVDENGRMAFWDYGVYWAGRRGSDQFYDIPHHRTISYGSTWGGSQPHPFATGAWRAPANNTNTFARESQIDAMAAAAEMDPVQFRLSNLKNERMIRVLKAAAEKFGWEPASVPGGRGYGVACGIDAGTYVAHIAEVEVDENTGEVQVKRVVCAQHMGRVVNPRGATLQAEGCITMGLGYALSEDIHFEGGRIEDQNFDTYELPRFSQVPKIETVLLEPDGLAPQGGGEPAIICMGGVIGNAIFDATGARLRRLPMTPERVREALARRGG